ncbi:hypothetical protein ACFFK0_18465 [Paenibacillus chartarius]|uniref:Transposase n=1 Tax=Paenibacillus chartarius TaxID=747481 RepID=A0ABV6DP51_9BACL
MTHSKSSDLSMNRAIDRLTNKEISAREVHNNPHLKQANRYICLGCEKLPNHLLLETERNKKQTILEHVAHDEHPFFRKGKLQMHYERCRFRNPDSNVISLAKANGISIDDRTKVLKILTSAKLVRKSGNPLGYSRRAYTKFFTHPAHQKFYFFLSSLLKDYEITTFKNNVSAFYVKTETEKTVNLTDIFGFQDDIVKLVEKNSSSCLAVVIGTVKNITHKGHILIDFTTSKVESNQNTKPFRLFVHQDYASKVGDVSLLENQKIACYGFAEKKILPHGTFYQMELYSIAHQIFFFDNPPTRERIGSVDEPDDPLDYALQECAGFTSRFWGTARVSDHEITELLVLNNQSGLDQLKAALVREESKQSRYEEFISNWDALKLKVENVKRQLEQLRTHLQSVTTAHGNESAKLSSKFGFNRKTLKTLEDDMNRTRQRIEETERALEAKENKLQQSAGLKKEWDEWKQSLQKRKQDIKNAERSAAIEMQLKQLLGSFAPLIFRVPLQHPRWNLFLGLNARIKSETSINVKAIFQLYVSQNQAWFPADHPFQERVIEHQVSINQLNESPREAMKGFYAKIGNAIIEGIKLMGWPVSKCVCPKCRGSMKLNYRYTKHYLVCWDTKCRGEYELEW